MRVSACVCERERVCVRDEAEKGKLQGRQKLSTHIVARDPETKLSLKIASHTHTRSRTLKHNIFISFFLALISACYHLFVCKEATTNTEPSENGFWNACWKKKTTSMRASLFIQHYCNHVPWNRLKLLVLHLKTKYHHLTRSRLLRVKLKYRLPPLFSRVTFLNNRNLRIPKPSM